MPEKFVNLKIDWKTFFKSRQNYFYSMAISIAIVLVVIIGFSFLDKQNKISSQISDDKTLTDIKTAAAQRIEQISGVPYSSLKNISADTQNPANSPSPVSIGQETFAGKQKIREVNPVDKVPDVEIFYLETSFINYESGQNQVLNFAKTGEPVVNKNWYSANYNKNITIQDGKILSFYLYTPEYSVDFYGGKYAIKELFDQKYYLNSFIDQSDNKNSEIRFLKSILDDPNVKILGKKTIDGKIMEIVEVGGVQTFQYPSKFPYGDFKTRYYIDLENFKLYLTENYNGENLVSSEKNLNNQTYSNAKPEDFFNLSELSDVEIKSVKSYDSSLAQQATSVENFANKFAIYYIPPLDNNFYVNDTTINGNGESQKLRNTKDFNPGLNFESDLSDNPKSISYYINSAINAEIFDTEPDFKSLDQANSQNLTIKNVVINTGDQNINAKFYEFNPVNVQTPDCTNPEVSTTNSSSIAKICTTESKIAYRVEKFLLFEAEKNWYKITENLSDSQNSILNKPIVNLEKLKLSEAKAIDSYNNEKRESYPVVQTVKMEDIKSDIRLLPGNLSEQNLFLTNITNSSITGEKSKCLKFIENIYDMYNCLIENFDGFGLYFQAQNNNLAVTGSAPDSPGPISTEISSPPNSGIPAPFQNNLQLAVLNTDNANQIAEEVYKNLLQNKVDVIMDSVNGRIKISDKKYQNNVVFTKVKNKTVLLIQESSYTANQESLHLSIIQNMDFDKGVEELNSQINKNTTDGISVSRPTPAILNR